MKQYKDSILLIILAIALFALCVYKLQPKVVNIYNIETQIKGKTPQLADLERQVETLKQQEAKVEANNQVYDKKFYKPGESGLDTEASFSVMFDDLIEMARYNSVKIYSIAYNYNPASDIFVKNAPGKYNVCQVNMQMIASYVDFNEFMKSIYKYPYLIGIDEIELKPYTKNKRILLINVELKLYSTN